MKKPNDIRIQPAVGGFVIDYVNIEMCRFGMGLDVLTPTTEVVPTEAKLIKRIREILEMQKEAAKPVPPPEVQLNG